MGWSVYRLIVKRLICLGLHLIPVADTFWRYIPYSLSIRLYSMSPNTSGLQVQTLVRSLIINGALPPHFYFFSIFTSDASWHNPRQLGFCALIIPSKITSRTGFEISICLFQRYHCFNIIWLWIFNSGSVCGLARQCLLQLNTPSAFPYSLVLHFWVHGWTHL